MREKRTWRVLSRMSTTTLCWGGIYEAGGSSSRWERCVRRHEYLVPSEKRVEDAKQWYFRLVVGQADLRAQH